MTKKKIPPAEGRAEAETDLITRLKGAATTAELLEAADVVGKQAAQVSGKNRRFLKKVEGELGGENKG